VENFYDFNPKDVKKVVFKVNLTETGRRSLQCGLQGEEKGHEGVQSHKNFAEETF
jgi:hypothetical protein